MLIDNPSGNYRFLKGIGPYSSGVVAMTGFEIVHVGLLQPLPLHLAFERIVQYLDQEGRAIQALCGMQLRIPAPLNFDRFYDFNQEYQQKLKDLGLFLEDVNLSSRLRGWPWSNKLRFIYELLRLYSLFKIQRLSTKGSPQI